MQEALKLSLQIDEQDASLQSILAQTRREAEERDLMEALRLSVQVRNELNRLNMIVKFAPD